MKHLTQNNEKHNKTRFNAFILRLWYITQTITKRKQTAKKALKTAKLKHYKNTAKNKRFFIYLYTGPRPPNAKTEPRPQPHFNIFHIFFSCSVSGVR